jgi:hypothetical protein
MNDLLSGLLKSVAPTLATAVAGPLGGAAISAIANKLGVGESAEEVAKALAADPAAAQKLQELELEFAKVDAADAADARKRETEIATSATAPWYSKVVTPLLAVGVFVFWSSVQWVLVHHVVPPEMREIVIRLLGQLDAAFMMVLTYYFGASHKH